MADACRRTAIDDRIVERSASAAHTQTESLYLSAAGAEVHQTTSTLGPEIQVVAFHDGQSQQRSLGGGRGASRQAGAELLDALGFDDAPERVAGEALALLDAPECPTERTNIVLDPGQMMLMIHESIGHPIELDRILGDERNYAGTSFVSLDMFGDYQYGSELLNVTFAPDVPGQLASYGWDDDGTPAKRTFIIENGVLMRPLGGAISQRRAGISGVANSRAQTWNRPAIDRMANLNVEPGDRPVEDIIGGIERGVWMETNASWSIDDSRNKFQFGCEFAREIVDGKLGRVLKNPNFRGISANFWRNLAGVANHDSFEVLGTPYCGKGEPNQVITVGHASPACWFRDVDVFGGAA